MSYGRRPTPGRYSRPQVQQANTERELRETIRRLQAENQRLQAENHRLKQEVSGKQ